MDVSWDYKVTGDQRKNPAVYAEKINLPSEIKFVTEQHLLGIFKADKFKRKAGRLKTWGRKKDKENKVIYENDPHYIAVRNGTPLHMDPPYPRYSHHLKIRADEGMFVRGINKVELKLERGTFYILDTHSPHQVFNKSKHDVWNVAVSIDSNEILDPKKAIEMCLKFAVENPIS
tara:strand:+ start:1424 stop:1945 length:522 start_codon:yes stop_codon:yes gene_type:complete